MPVRALRVLGDPAPLRAAPVLVPRFGAGFHKEELAEGLPFRWLSTTGRLEFDPAGRERFLELSVRSHFHDLSQTLAPAGPHGDGPAPIALLHGWNLLSLVVPAGAAGVTLRINKPYPREYYPGDGRELAVQARQAWLHAEAARHGHVRRQHENALLNRRELLDGRSELASTPPKLGVDVQGACNVKPPCVYCAWDFNKALEGENSVRPFTQQTLGEWGDFFDNAAALVNCSIGEPFMTRDIDPLLDAFGERGKLLELTTNGQILTDANIARLLGRNVHLYVSLDAATPETYARLRNERFTQVLDNVRRLVAAKGGRGRLPLVYVVFMPMRANRHEADAVVELCAALEVDQLVLRPLNDSEGVRLVWDRAGYHFDYQQELLPFAELVKLSGRVRERCRQRNVELADQLDFGGELRRQFPEAFEAGRREVLGPPASPSAPESTAASGPVEAPPPMAPPPPPPPSLGAERLPACIEPWTSLYVLRRGTLPCCYGGRPIAGPDDFRKAWNGRLMRAIRRELARGRFHGYCFDSPDCPIVRKAAEARRLPPSERVRRLVHRVHARWERVGYGWPGWLYRQARHRTLNALGHVPGLRRR